MTEKEKDELIQELRTQAVDLLVLLVEASTLLQVSRYNPKWRLDGVSNSCKAFGERRRAWQSQVNPMVEQIKERKDEDS